MSAGSAARLPVGPVLAATTATQSLSTMAVLALAAVAPQAAAQLGVSPALIGYQLGLVYCGAMLTALVGGALVRRFGAARASQTALWMVAAGAVLSALGTLQALAAGAVAMGLAYGVTNPAASHLLLRAPASRNMNLLFSVKQCGVPIGGALAGVLVPPFSVALGWQGALAACALLLAGLGVLLGRMSPAWDTDRDPAVPLFASPFASVRLIWRHEGLRWVALASLLYSAVQLCLTGFLVTYLVTEGSLSLVAAGAILALTNASGAAGRLAWGWFADRLRSGTLAMIINGALAAIGSLSLGAAGAGPRLELIAAAACLFGFSAMGWNGVYMALIARHSAAHSVGAATGGSLVITFIGIIAGPPAFGALHERLGVSYSASFALLALIAAAGVACSVVARRRLRSGFVST